MRTNLTQSGLLLGALLTATSAVAATPNNTIELWVRTPGSYGGATPPPVKSNPKSVDLATLPQESQQRADLQYQGATAYYRGVALREVITRYNPPAQSDLVLLHFRNGVQIPLSFRDQKAMSRLEPLLALGLGKTAQGPFVSEFPPLSKHVEGYADIRQVTFQGNKLVVKERWHPDVPEQAQADFTPWQMADSLAGLEFVQANAYYRQFLPTAEVRPGMEVFRQSCQFCHGVRKVGASFGWDYAQPIELHTYRSDPTRLYNHIRYRIEYRATWEQMPALKHVTEADATLLWTWMRAVSTAPLTRYTPTN